MIIIINEQNPINLLLLLLELEIIELLIKLFKIAITNDLEIRALLRRFSQFHKDEELRLGDDRDFVWADLLNVSYFFVLSHFYQNFVLANEF